MKSIIFLVKGGVLHVTRKWGGLKPPPHLRPISRRKEIFQKFLFVRQDYLFGSGENDFLDFSSFPDIPPMPPKKVNSEKKIQNLKKNGQI